MTSSFIGTSGPAGIKLSRKNKVYKDISLNWGKDDLNPLTNDIISIRDEVAINNAIRNIIQTYPLETVFNRDFGSQVINYLFDFVDEATAGVLKNEIERAIDFCEPRVQLVAPNKLTTGLNYAGVVRNENEAVYVEAQPHENQFFVRITYQIVGTDKVFFVDQILTPTR